MIASGALWPWLALGFRVASIEPVLATAPGAASGVAIARVRLVDLSLEPFASALYVTPMVALTPLVVVWAGFGDAAMGLKTSACSSWAAACGVRAPAHGASVA